LSSKKGGILSSKSLRSLNLRKQMENEKGNQMSKRQGGELIAGEKKIPPKGKENEAPQMKTASYPYLGRERRSPNNMGHVKGKRGPTMTSKTVLPKKNRRKEQNVA